MAAPAECASSVDAAICTGVTGTCALFLTESPEPVTAQVIKTALVDTGASPNARVEADVGSEIPASIAPKPRNTPSQTATAREPFSKLAPGVLRFDRRRIVSGAIGCAAARELESACQGRARHTICNSGGLHRCRPHICGRATLSCCAGPGELAVPRRLYGSGAHLQHLAGSCLPSRRPEPCVSAEARDRAAAGRDRERDAARGAPVPSGLDRCCAGLVRHIRDDL